MLRYEVHPFADDWPQMGPEDFELLEADIEQHGIHIPVVLFNGKLLDGRHRVQAADNIEERTGRPISVDVIDFKGDTDDALALVNSLNDKRRHLTQSQRACIGVKRKHEAQETIKQGQRTDLTCGNVSTSSQRNPPARDVAGAIVGVSGRMIDKAEKVMEADLELFERVKAGEMPLSAAENALAIRNGTQTTAQAVKAVASEIVAAMGVENISEEKLEKVGRVLAGETNNIHVSDDSYEWYTPADVVEAARRVMREITLDPASSPAAQEVIKARYYMTKEQDGLCQSWQHPMFDDWVQHGGLDYAVQVASQSHCNIWLNPPYSADLVQKFAAKLLAEIEAVNVHQAIVLVNNATDTKWFHSLLDECSAVCFTSGRVKFWTPGEADLQGRQGQALFYFSSWERPETFACEFSKFGTVLTRYE